MPKPTVFLDETSHPIESFIYFFKLHTGEDLVSESLEFIDITKTPKKNKLFHLKNPTVLVLIQDDAGRYMYVPQPWVARTLIEGDWFTLFGNAIAGWAMPSKDILTIYRSSIIMLEQLRAERASERALLEEQASLITKMTIAPGTANTVSGHEGPVSTSEIQLKPGDSGRISTTDTRKLNSNTKVSLDDFTETFKALKGKPQ